MTHDTTGGPTADNLIERIKADREAEEKAKGWTEKYLHQSTIDTRHLPEAKSDPNVERQLRRLGRIGQMEARILADAEALKAADELAGAVVAWDECNEQELVDCVINNLQSALTAYRKARENNDDQER